MKKEKVVLKINFLNGININTDNEALTFFKNQDNKLNNRTVSNILDNILNYKLTNLILNLSSINKNELLSDLSEEQLNSLINNLLNFEVLINSSNSFDKAQVCSGGVSLNEVDLASFESLIVSKVIPFLS